jgi:hypothetical protein
MTKAKKYNRKNNDVQSTTKKNKVRATHNPIKTVHELRCY